jgi:hypothetical protein
MFRLLASSPRRIIMRRLPARHAIPAIFTALAVIAAACSDTAGPDTRPATLEMLDGDDQQSLMHQPLPSPLRVRVLDAAGRPVPDVAVGWWVSAGTITSEQPVTDADGIAAASWYFLDANGWGRVGTHTAVASAAGLPTVTFTGHARLGRNVENVWIEPDVVDVADGDAVITFRVHATDDFGELTSVAVQLLSPSAAQRIEYTPLALVEGDGTDGMWAGDVTIPHGSEPGVWVISGVRIASGCAWTISPDHALAYIGAAYQFTVTAGADAGDAGSVGLRAATAYGDVSPLAGSDSTACVTAGADR